MGYASATIATPPGPLTLIADAATGTVVASGWAPDADALIAAIGPARLPAALTAPGAIRRRGDLGAATAAVDAYLAGELDAIATVPVAQDGGPFTRRAWAELRAIPPGAPISYAELAARCGSPGAVRAAGRACATNRVALLVPCHRVRRGDGTLGGFAYGEPVKRWLLDHERRADGRR